jgi:endoplasmic reticulum chaperone BiP
VWYARDLFPAFLCSAVAVANWAVFDRTKQGIALAALCALGAPAAELVLLQIVPLWHYPRGDILGGAFVSWVPWCYAFYTPFLTNLARCLWQRAHSRGA